MTQSTSGKEGFYTYLHCTPDGAPFYVGKGCGVRSHTFCNGRNKAHREIVKEHGVRNISVFVFPCDSEKQAYSDEKQQIALLRKEGYALVNISEGGRGAKHSDETKRRIGAAQKGKIQPPELKRRLSEINKGKKLSAEVVEKIRAFHTGKKKKPEAIAKTAAYHIGNKHFLGKTHTPEAREKIRRALVGRHHTEESNAKNSESHVGREHWFNPETGERKLCRGGSPGEGFIRGRRNKN